VNVMEIMVKQSEMRSGCNAGLRTDGSGEVRKMNYGIVIIMVEVYCIYGYCFSKILPNVATVVRSPPSQIT
jgi:hypothetical protein